MSKGDNETFKLLANPVRRAIFEDLSREATLPSKRQSMREQPETLPGWVAIGFPPYGMRQQIAGDFVTRLPDVPQSM